LSGAEPQPANDLVHFSLKIGHLVATVLITFLRINLPNFVYSTNYGVQGRFTVLEGVWFGVRWGGVIWSQESTPRRGSV